MSDKMLHIIKSGSSYTRYIGLVTHDWKPKFMFNATYMSLVFLVVTLVVGACSQEGTSESAMSTAVPDGANPANDTDSILTTPLTFTLPTSTPELVSRSNYPAVHPSNIESDGTIMSIEYGHVPDNFLPEIPDLETLPEPFVSIYMEEKSSIGSLIGIELMPFRWNSAYQYSDHAEFGDQAKKMVEEDYAALIKDNAIVMECNYKISRDTAVYFRRYWFGITPAVADPGRLRTRLRDHPLLKSINGTRNQCPTNRNEAESTFVSAYRPLGGNWYNLGVTKGPGYVRLEYRYTNADGLTDVYDFLDFDTSHGVPVQITSGTLTVDKHGKGRLVAGVDLSCDTGKYGGEITFYPAGDNMRFDSVIDCLSLLGDISGANTIHVRFERRDQE